MYTIIPIEHGIIIGQFIAVWSMSSPTAYVVARGVYKKSTIQEQIETVFTTIPNQQGELIQKDFSYIDDMEDGQIYKMSIESILILGQLPNDVRTYCESLTPSCIFFDTSQDVLNYMKYNELN